MALSIPLIVSSAKIIELTPTESARESLLTVIEYKDKNIVIINIMVKISIIFALMVMFIDNYSKYLISPFTICALTKSKPSS